MTARRDTFLNLSALLHNREPLVRAGPSDDTGGSDHEAALHFRGVPAGVLANTKARMEKAGIDVLFASDPRT